MLRPRVDLDALARTYDDAIARLSATGARVVMFTIFDPGGSGIYGPVRGRMAIFNEWVREIADRHDATIVDMWRMRDIEIAGVMDTDRMHLNSHGHTHMARAVLDAIGVEHALEPVTVEPAAACSHRREQWAANAQWTREFLVPWVHRRSPAAPRGTPSPRSDRACRASGSPAPVAFWPAVHGRHCGCSSVGRARPSQGRCREFESRHPLQFR